MLILFFWLFQTWPVTLRIRDRCFLVALCHLIVRQPSSKEEASPSAVKHSGVVLVPCLAMEVCPYRYFWWYRYFWDPYVSFFATDEFSIGLQKLLQGLVSHDWYFPLALLHSVPYLFFLCQSPSSSLCSVFDSILSKIDEVLSIKASANVFVLWHFNAHHKYWQTYSGGTENSCELCYNFSKISNGLTQMVNFPTRIPDYDSHIPTLLDTFLSSDASICSKMAFHPLGNSDHAAF